jgi:anti-sigma factor RsiW
MNVPDGSRLDRDDPESPSSDPYREWDAAYLLGALSPAERREFEEHLAGCADCRAEVAEIAGIPGLLAQMSPENAVSIVGPTAVSTVREDTVVTAPEARRSDDLPEEISWPPMRQDRRSRRLLRTVVALAAACVLFAGVIGVAAVRGTFSVSRPSASAPVRLAFTPVVPNGITAVVDVVPVASGTELRVECQYAFDGSGPDYTGRDYTLVVTDRSGNSTPVKTWTARPNRVMTPSGMSPLPASDIAAVDIRPAGSDKVLLTAKLR